LNEKKIAPMKDLEERDDRAQQRRELAKRCKGCHVARKKRAGPASQNPTKTFEIQSARALSGSH